MINAPHPFLPSIDRPHTAADVNAFPKDQRGPDFYLACLRYGQSLWQNGLPAQCILQCNRALSLPLTGDEPILRQHPLPYQALAWLILNAPADQFLGNPRRHWQHLATRMVEPNKALRTWRAWACWHLAKTLLPESEFPADLKQIRNEHVIEPTFDQIFAHLEKLSPADDLATWQHALHWARQQRPTPNTTPLTEPPRLRLITAAELPTVIDLAHRIWPRYYPSIISPAQIDYMLSVWYNLSTMQSEVASQKVSYALIESATTPIGYLGYETQPDSPVLFLSKLYLLPEHHGQGHGRLALDWLQHQALATGHTGLRLRVNKHNAPAIRAYLRAGFHFAEDICSDIGNGFVMDDFVMEKNLIPQPTP